MADKKIVNLPPLLDVDQSDSDIYEQSDGSGTNPSHKETRTQVKAKVYTGISGDSSVTSSGVMTVTKINTVPLGSTTATSGNLLIGSGTQWVSTPMSGDSTINSSGVTTLSTVNANVGSFGDSTHVGSFTANAKGQVTAAANVLISGTSPGGAASGDLAGTYPNPTVAKINTNPLGTTTPTLRNLLMGNGTTWQSSTMQQFGIAVGGFQILSTSTTLTNPPVPVTILNFSTNGFIKLPPANQTTSIQPGQILWFSVFQPSTGTIDIQKSDGSSLFIAQQGQYFGMILADNSTAAGSWTIGVFPQSFQGQVLGGTASGISRNTALTSANGTLTINSGTDGIIDFAVTPSDTFKADFYTYTTCGGL